MFELKKQVYISQKRGEGVGPLHSLIIFIRSLMAMEEGTIIGSQLNQGSSRSTLMSEKKGKSGRIGALLFKG